MKVDVVQVPYDSGHHGRRMGAGPLRLVDAGLLEGLSAGGHEVRLVPVELESGFLTEIVSAFQAIRVVRGHVTEAIGRGRFPVILAGNCIAGLGAVAALGRPPVYWLDAHGDLNNPESTRSGFLDGMALSILMGRCWRSLAAEAGVEPVAEEQVHLIGARDLDPAEAEFLAASSVHVWDVESNAAIPGPDGAEPCYLHIDLDVLDPSADSEGAIASAAMRIAATVVADTAARAD